MTTDVAADVTGERSHPCIDAVEVFHFCLKSDVVDGLNNGLRPHIRFIWRVAQDDDTGGVVPIGGNIRFDKPFRLFRLLVFCDSRLIDVAVVFLASRKLAQHIHKALKFRFPLFCFLANSIQCI